VDEVIDVAAAAAVVEVRGTELDLVRVPCYAIALWRETEGGSLTSLPISSLEMTIPPLQEKVSDLRGRRNLFPRSPQAQES
jgi:hypothetical protein